MEEIQKNMIFILYWNLAKIYEMLSILHNLFYFCSLNIFFVKFIKIYKNLYYINRIYYDYFLIYLKI
jgi:hypothetical protein